MKRCSGLLALVFGALAPMAAIANNSIAINGVSGVPVVFHTLIGVKECGADDWQGILARFTCRHDVG